MKGARATSIFQAIAVCRDYLGVNFGEIDIVEGQSPNHRRREVPDPSRQIRWVVRYAVSDLGGWAYSWLLRISHVISIVRRKLNRPIGR